MIFQFSFFKYIMSDAEPNINGSNDCSSNDLQFSQIFSINLFRFTTTSLWLFRFTRLCRRVDQSLEQLCFPVNNNFASWALTMFFSFFLFLLHWTRTLNESWSLNGCVTYKLLHVISYRRFAHDLYTYAQAGVGPVTICSRVSCYMDYRNPNDSRVFKVLPFQHRTFFY